MRRTLLFRMVPRVRMTARQIVRATAMMIMLYSGHARSGK